MNALAEVKPRKLFIIADGPRPDRPGEAEACAAARAAAERITWDCEVVKNYSDVNLGCGRRPATGISWVFEQVEEAIILEDDCVADPTFFRFCEELLERYRDDERVMHINGSTYRRKETNGAHSYHFSQFLGCWGWATWRRAWKLYDYEVKLWPEFRQLGWLEAVLRNNEHELRYWYDRFQNAYDQPADLSFWDYQWAFACWANSGLAIVPSRNLVSNVGSEIDATHTFKHPMCDLPARPLSFPLVHPPTVLQNWKLDQEYMDEVLTPRAVPPLARLRRAVGKLVPGPAKQVYRLAAHKAQSAVAHAAII